MSLKKETFDSFMDSAKQIASVFPFCFFVGKTFFPIDFKYLALICGFCGILDNGQWMITPKAGMCMNSSLMFIRNEKMVCVWWNYAQPSCSVYDYKKKKAQESIEIKSLFFFTLKFCKSNC